MISRLRTADSLVFPSLEYRPDHWYIARWGWAVEQRVSGYIWNVGVILTRIQPVDVNIPRLKNADDILWWMVLHWVDILSQNIVEEKKYRYHRVHTVHHWVINDDWKFSSYIVPLVWVWVSNPFCKTKCTGVQAGCNSSHLSSLLAAELYLSRVWTTLIVLKSPLDDFCIKFQCRSFAYCFVSYRCPCHYHRWDGSNRRR